MPKSGNFFLLLAALALVMAGCGSTQSASQEQAAQTQAGQTQSADLAANGNLAPVSDSSQPAAGQPPQQAQNEPAPAAEPYDNSQPVYAPDPPPALPEYTQPPTPGENYMWTPGYWSWSDSGYYWVPGAWVLAPFIDALWTPPWWQFDSGRYLWHPGYWDRYVGYYGGINYGFGYTGRGYYGGYWNSGRFDYNRTVTNVNPSVIRNFYERKVADITPPNHVSYNGGRGGVNARPTPAELAALREPRRPPVPAQVTHQQTSGQMRGQFAAAGHGRPVVVAQNNPLQTNYRKPAPQPETQARPPVETRPARGARPVPQPQRAQAPAQRTESNDRRLPVTPEQRPATESQRPPVETRPAQRARPEPAQQPGQAARPAARPELNRPAPQERPAAPEQRPAAQPQRTEPQARPPAEPRRDQATRAEPARPANPSGNREDEKR